MNKKDALIALTKKAMGKNRAAWVGHLPPKPPTQVQLLKSILLRGAVSGSIGGAVGGAVGADPGGRLEGALRGGVAGGLVGPVGGLAGSSLKYPPFSPSKGIPKSPLGAPIGGAAFGASAGHAQEKRRSEPKKEEKKEPEEKKEAGEATNFRVSLDTDHLVNALRNVIAEKAEQPMPAKKPISALKPEEKKEAGFELFARKAAAVTSDAAAIGLLSGYEDCIIPSQAAFEKVAAKTGYSANGLKHAYLKKIAAMGKWPWLLGGLAAATVGAPMLSGAYNRVMYPSYYSDAPGYGMMDAPNVGAYGGFSPRAESELWKTIAREGLKQRQASSLLQGISGAYRPAGNPWGNSHPMMMPQ